MRRGDHIAAARLRLGAVCLFLGKSERNELVFIRPFVLLSFGALEFWRSGKIEFFQGSLL
jgi:hypothetical protein